jgi:hypothetical protein
MITLEDIRACFEGAVPSSLATCASDGTPNVSYISQVYYVGHQQVALTFQFFNKTRQNILQNPQASLIVIDPVTADQYRLSLIYIHTEEKGATFERMKAHLSGIASATGMESIFKLKGADIYKVINIEALNPRPQQQEQASHQPKNSLLNLRHVLAAINQAQELGELFEATLKALTHKMGIEYAILLLPDESGKKLYTVESIGYPSSGVGAEFPIGFGVIGTTAQISSPIRINHMTAQYSYVQSMQDFFRHAKDSANLETQIKFPGLDKPHSQIAIPILDRDRLQGILYAESMQDNYFTYDHEDALECVGLMMGQAMAKLQSAEICTVEENEMTAEFVGIPSSPTNQGLSQMTPCQIRYYRKTKSIFIDEDYLIKGVAGCILWTLLQIYQQEDRRQFSNKELRLNKLLDLPDIDDNLEARLILLKRRLHERCDFIHIVKTGRGIFELEIGKPFTLSLLD